MSENLTAILTDAKQFSSDEIQIEIDAIGNDRSSFSNRLKAVEIELQDAKVKNLGNPATTEINALEKERDHLKDNITIMGVALEKLERIHANTVSIEADTEIKEIQDKIKVLYEQKEKTVPEVLEKLGKTIAQVCHVFGDRNIEFEWRGFFVGLSEAQKQIFREAKQKAMDGRATMPSEIDSLRLRRRDLEQIHYLDK